MLRFIKLLRFFGELSTLNPRLNSSSPPLSREARKLLRFIKSLEKEHDSLYRSRLLILVRIQSPPPPRLPREARNLLRFIKSFERRRFVVQFSTLNPRPKLRSAEAFKFHKIMRERRRFVVQFLTLNPSEFRSPPLPAQSAEAFKFHKIMRERRRLAVQFSTLNPRLNSVPPLPR